MVHAGLSVHVKKSRLNQARSAFSYSIWLPIAVISSGMTDRASAYVSSSSYCSQVVTCPSTRERKAFYLPAFGSTFGLDRCLAFSTMPRLSASLMDLYLSARAGCC